MRALSDTMSTTLDCFFQWQNVTCQQGRYIGLDHGDPSAPLNEHTCLARSADALIARGLVANENGQIEVTALGLRLLSKDHFRREYIEELQRAPLPRDAADRSWIVHDLMCSDYLVQTPERIELSARGHRAVALLQEKPQPDQ